MVRVGAAEGTARAPCFGVSLSAALALVPQGDGRRGPACFRSARLKRGPRAQDAGWTAVSPAWHGRAAPRGAVREGEVRWG